MGSKNSLQDNSEFSPKEESKLSNKFASAVSLDDPGTSTESSVAQMVTREKLEELAKKKEKPQIKAPFAFISEENIANYLVDIKDENTVTFTKKPWATYAPESDPAQLFPSVTLENLDSINLSEDSAQYTTEIIPFMLGWKGISCETLKLHNLPIDAKLLRAIITSGVKRLHMLNCTAAPPCSFDFRPMKTLEELNISFLDFNDGFLAPTSLKNLRVHCPKSKECSESTHPEVIAHDSEFLEHA
jgi:hypothetical protein